MSKVIGNKEIWCPDLMPMSFAITFSFYKINFIILLTITEIISISWKLFSAEYMDCLEMKSTRGMISQNQCG